MTPNKAILAKFIIAGVLIALSVALLPLFVHLFTYQRIYHIEAISGSMMVGGIILLFHTYAHQNTHRTGS